MPSAATAVDPPLPRDLRRLVARTGGPGDYAIIRMHPAALRLLLAHPRASAVVEALAASGRIGPRLADELRDAIRDRP
jgi:hypothetical protein